MLRPEYLKGVSAGLAAQFAELEGLIIWDIARRIESTISDPMNLTATAEIQLKIMQSMDYDMSKIRESLASKLKITLEEMDTIIYESGRISYEDDALMYQVADKFIDDFHSNAFVQNIIRATQDKLNQDLLNLSNTLGFVEKEGKFYGVDDYFKRSMDKAVFQTASGAFDYQSVSRRIIKEMASSGVRTVDYESGRSVNLESSVRNNLLTGLSQMSGKIAMQNALDMDQDIMELSAHGGARPTHSLWQGQLVSLSGQIGYLSLADIGYGDVTGFQGANCAHSWYPYFEGVSERKYTAEELEELNDQSEKYEYEGKKYSEYQAGQKMRQIERSIAQTKRELIGLDATKDKDMFTAKSVYLRRQRDLYEEFAKISNQQMQDWRTQVYNFDRSKAAKASGTYRKLDNVSQKMYNSSTLSSYLKEYKKSVDSGSMSALVRSEDYLKYKSIIDKELIGIKTADGVEIKTQSKHFIERVFGTLNDPKTGTGRSGVELDSIKSALQNPIKIIESKKINGEISSKKYIGIDGTVSINKEGNLIQTNPTDKKLIDRIKKGENSDGSTNE